MTKRPILTLALVSLLGAGCATKGDVQAVATQNARLRADLKAMEDRYADATKSMDGLRQVVDEANALLSRNSADVGSRVEEQTQEIALLKGKLEEAHHAIQTLEKKLEEQASQVVDRVTVLEQNQQKIVDKVAPAMPSDAAGLWTAAQEFQKNGERAQMRRYLNELLKGFPTDARAPAARLTIGKSFADENNHRQAAGHYQKLLDDFPKSAEVAEAMYLLGVSFIELKFCTDAQAIFLDVTKRFKSSPQAKNAATQAKAVKKLFDDKTRCTS
jgi:TolA-binding protein